MIDSATPTRINGCGYLTSGTILVRRAPVSCTGLDPDQRGHSRCLCRSRRRGMGSRPIPRPPAGRRRPPENRRPDRHQQSAALARRHRRSRLGRPPTNHRAPPAPCGKLRSMPLVGAFATTAQSGPPGAAFKCGGISRRRLDAQCERISIQDKQTRTFDPFPCSWIRSPDSPKVEHCG